MATIDIAVETLRVAEYLTPYLQKAPREVCYGLCRRPHSDARTRDSRPRTVRSVESGDDREGWDAACGTWRSKV